MQKFTIKNKTHSLLGVLHTMKTVYGHHNGIFSCIIQAQKIK
jgi:hypothetical protein